MIYERPDTGNGVHWAGNHSLQYASDLQRSGTFPSSWWAAAEKLAKSAYSTVLVDLGQSEPSNLLLDGEALQKFTADFNATGELTTGPGRRPYVYSPNDDKRLNTTPAVIQATYLCNKPRRKNTGTIVWLIILADIVFLQALWVIYKAVVDAWLLRKCNGANSCEGCEQCPFHTSYEKV